MVPLSGMVDVGIKVGDLLRESTDEKHRKARNLLSLTKVTTTYHHKHSKYLETDGFIS